MDPDEINIDSTANANISSKIVLDSSNSIENSTNSTIPDEIRGNLTDQPTLLMDHDKLMEDLDDILINHSNSEEKLPQNLDNIHENSTTNEKSELSTDSTAISNVPTDLSMEFPTEIGSISRGGLTIDRPVAISNLDLLEHSSIIVDDSGNRSIPVQSRIDNFDSSSIAQESSVNRPEPPRSIFVNGTNVEDLSNGIMGGNISSDSIDSNNANIGGEANIEKMAKLYDKYSLQCAEIEKLEKENQNLRESSMGIVRERDHFQHQLKESNQNYATKSQEYERRMLDLESQCKVLRDRSAAQEAHYRKTLADQQAKFNAQIEQLKRSTDQAHRDKDAAVIKYAQREKELLTMEASVQKNQQHAQQLTVERDALNARLRASKNEKQQIVQVVEQKDNEIADLKKDLERVKAFIQEADLRVKLANKRVEDSDSAQKELKVEQERMQKKLKESKEETELIRAECQRMIRNFQEATEKKTLEIEVQKQEHSDQDEIYRMVIDELEALKKRHKETLIEFESMKAKSATMEEELSARNRDASDRSTEVDNQKTTIEELRAELDILQTAVDELAREQKKTRDLERQLTQSREEQEDCEREASQCRTNAERMLELMEQLTQKNSVVQAENCSLSNKLQSIESENVDLNRRCLEMESTLAGLEEELRQLKSTSTTDSQQLRHELEEKTNRESQLMTELEDEQNQNKILKKKHAASVKELKSELSVVRRRLEAYESGTGSQGSGGSIGGDDRGDASSRTGGGGGGGQLSASRASSYTSLDQMAAKGDSPVTGYENPASHNHTHIGGGQLHMQFAGVGSNSGQGGHGQGVCEHNQAMIEKIVKLQRMLARRTEKIEFLEEHAKQLVAELQKKSRLVQMYALRDESGALAPESVDLNKAQLAKRGQTIMGSVYGGGTAAGQTSAPVSTGQLTLGPDGQLTPELALQMIRKLQAVLEDTLLKNITLKDSMETLGEEIARISRENRELKLRYETSK